MHIESIPGVRWGEDASDGQIVIDLAELCGWLGVPCDAHNVCTIRTVILEAMLLLASEVAVELNDLVAAGEGVSA